MNNIIIVGLLIIAFAWLVTVHVAIVFGLAKQPPRWRALVAFLVPVIAPYWAWQAQMKKRAAMWVGGVLVYLVALLLASH